MWVQAEGLSCLPHGRPHNEKLSVLCVFLFYFNYHYKAVASPGAKKPRVKHKLGFFYDLHLEVTLHHFFSIRSFTQVIFTHCKRGLQKGMDTKIKDHCGLSWRL